ncbi:MAG: hypothetical protein JO199_03210 [Candidatus Eremiobacteraeota bacterium]|nr:hypothetical protein [Candidatus Eremiobacteraeota bacterium]
MRRFYATILCGVIFACIALPAAADTPAPLTAFATAWSSMNGYSTSIHCFNVKGSDQQNSVYQYSFTKPSTISMNIVSGPSAGNSVNWSGGDTVRAGHGMFTKNFALTDPTVTSLRGATVVDLSFGSILQHAQQTPGSMSVSQVNLGGATVNVVNLTPADPTKDNGLTREALFLSTTTNLPVRVDGFEGSQLVTSCSFSETSSS